MNGSLESEVAGARPRTIATSSTASCGGFAPVRRGAMCRKSTGNRTQSTNARWSACGVRESVAIALAETMAESGHYDIDSTTVCVAAPLPEGERHALSSPTSHIPTPPASSRRRASDLSTAWRSAGVIPRSRTSSRTRSSWRGAVGGVHSGLGTSCVLRASGTSDPIMSLLRDGVAVRGDRPRFASDQQLMQCAERRQRDLRGTDLEPRAIDHIELPCRQNRHDARRQLHVHELTRSAPLDLNATRALPIKRMPAIVDDDILPIWAECPRDCPRP